MIDVEPATTEDLAAIRALLDANELPIQDLVESAATFLVARVDGVLAGVVGTLSRHAMSQRTRP